MNLTDRERLLLDTLVAEGSANAACLRLGIKANSFSTRLRAARVRNGHRTNLHLVLAWDRARRAA